MAEQFIVEGKMAYDNGRMSCKDRQSVFDFHVEHRDNDKILSQHHSHHPEIDIISATTATGVWDVEDTHNLLESDARVRGTGIYRDEYVKEDGQWKFAHTGYERVWSTTESVEPNKTRPWMTMFDEEEAIMRATRARPPGKPIFCNRVRSND